MLCNLSPAVPARAHWTNLMTLRPLLLLSLVVVAMTAAETRDLIILKANDQKKLAFIDGELADKLIIRVSAQSKPSEQPLRDVRSWEYIEMKDGFWPQAVEALNAGRYAVAADTFNQVATSGAKEWQKVYGAYYEGASWEAAGDYVKAAEAFGRAASVNPLHRLTLDAKYRQGFAQARAKQDADATKVADALAEMAKKDRVVAADLRANAIRAVLAFNAGNGEQMKKLGRLANFNIRDDPEAYVQFGTFFADALRQLKMGRDAEIEYKRMLSTPELDPSQKVPLQLGYAKVLMDSDKGSALVELLRIDALPYGSIDAKCEVRYLAGLLLAAEVKAGRATPPGEQAAKDWLAVQERQARMLLAAAAASTSELPAKAAATTELEALGPEGGEPAKDVEKKKDAAAPGAAAVPAAPAK